MISNADITIYHKELDLATRLEKWTRFNYDNVWCFSSQRASVNDGYDDTNNVEIRIPLTESIDISNFSKGDIIVKGKLTTDINTTKELADYEKYAIVGINNNDFGSKPHIHLTGK